MAISILANGTDETPSGEQTLAAGVSALVWITAGTERIPGYAAVDIQFKNADNSWTTQLSLSGDRPNGRFEGPVIWRAKRTSTYGLTSCGLQLGS